MEARKLLFDAEGADVPPARKPTPSSRLEPRGALTDRLVALLELVSPAAAIESDARTAEVRAALDGYRAAFEHKDLDALAHYYARFTDAQREALTRYLQNADGLHVEFSDVRVTVSGDEAAVSFTRQDRFVDHKTGETQQVVVRVTKLFAKRADGWQIVPGQ